MGKLTRFGVSIDSDLAAKFDNKIEQEGYSNRSEAIRDLIRDNLVHDEWNLDGSITVATLSLVYNHHTRDLSENLNSLQHDHHELIVSTLHVHIDHDNCLEVLVMRGPNNRIKKISDRLLATRGVKHGKLTMTTTGKGL